MSAIENLVSELAQFNKAEKVEEKEKKFDWTYVIIGIAILALILLFTLISKRPKEIELMTERTERLKGFEKVKPSEYAEIPHDAIEPFTQDKIHDLIAHGRKIIRCKDCGAYYDEEVLEYYGNICARMGCSNSEV